MEYGAPYSRARGPGAQGKAYHKVCTILGESCHEFGTPNLGQGVLRLSEDRRKGLWYWYCKLQDLYNEIDESGHRFTNKH